MKTCNGDVQLNSETEKKIILIKNRSKKMMGK